MTKIKRDDIIWLAGLLEGEGYFGLSDGKYPKIAVNMCDGDVINRIADMWNARVGREGNIHSAQIGGVYAVSWMMTLYILFGERRRKRISEIIKFWREHVYSRTSKGFRTMAKCHPDRVVHGSGLCDICYMEWYNKERSIRKQLLKLAG